MRWCVSGLHSQCCHVIQNRILTSWNILIRTRLYYWKTRVINKSNEAVVLWSHKVSSYNYWNPNLRIYVINNLWPENNNIMAIAGVQDCIGHTRRFLALNSTDCEKSLQRTRQDSGKDARFFCFLFS